MTEDTLSRIEGWCDAEDDLTLAGSTITVTGDPPIPLEAEIGEEALTLTHVHKVDGPPPAFADRAVEMLSERGSMVGGEVLTGTDGTEVHLRYPIYLDGLNRQAFVVAVRELTRTVDGMRRLEKEVAAPPAGTAAVAAAGDGPAPPPTEPDPEPKPSPAPAASAPRPAQPAPWRPTHQVPATGMAAWTEPNPAVAPAANLGPGVQLLVTETRGAWAHVTGSNGWTGWVDARILQPAGTVPAPAARPAAAAQAGARQPAVLPLAGGIMMLASAFLAWGDWSVATGMDVPVYRLWPLTEVNTFWSWSQPRVGMILIVAGILAAAAALAPRFPSGLRILGGVLGIAMGLGVVLWFAVNGVFGDVFDLRLTGVFVAMAGGVLALARGSVTR